MRALAIAILLAAAIARADDVLELSPALEGSERSYTVCFKQPGRCSSSTSVICEQNSDCPATQTCAAPAGVSPTLCSSKPPIRCDVTPTALTWRVDDVGAQRTCAGGAMSGQGCEQDSDCPSSTCTGGELLSLQTATPSAACHTITVAGSVNQVARATNADRPEVHALTICWTWATGTECRELRFGVRRQRWS